MATLPQSPIGPHLLTLHPLMIHSYMLDINQNWVVTALSLTLHWLLVRVNPNCPTSIASLDVAECVSGDSFLPDSALNGRIRNMSMCVRSGNLELISAMFDNCSRTRIKPQYENKNHNVFCSS